MTLFGRLRHGHEALGYYNLLLTASLPQKSELTCRTRVAAGFIQPETDTSRPRGAVQGRLGRSRVWSPALGTVSMTSGRDVAPVCPVCTELLGSYGGPVSLPCGALLKLRVGISGTSIRQVNTLYRRS